jgi:predicted transcriptional regulator
MTQFNWSILETFGDGTTITKVRYFVQAIDDANTVETEGEHTFQEGTVYKPLNEIKEENLISWLQKDTTKDDINIIKLNLENQLKALKENNKVDFPWETNTFSIE